MKLQANYFIRNKIDTLLSTFQNFLPTHASVISDVNLCLIEIHTLFVIADKFKSRSNKRDFVREGK